jgi:hypothetical protein
VEGFAEILKPYTMAWFIIAFAKACVHAQAAKRAKGQSQGIQQVHHKALSLHLQY